MDQTTTTASNTTVVQPKTPKVVVRVSNIENLLKSAKDLNTTSRKIRRTFEKNTYQKRTQLSVLKRYKRRLDSIEKQEEERRKKASKKKIKLPSIKKFAGSFFAPDASKDPLKAIAALAAFKGLEKLSQGNVLGAIGPGLVAAGLVAGPSLIGAGIDVGVNKIFGRNKLRRGFDVSGRRVGSSTQERYLSRYGDKAFKRRFGRDALRRTRQGTTATEAVSMGGRTAKAFGRLGKSIIPGVGAVLGAVDAKMRADEGDITGSRISAASATLDTLTAASAATGIGLVATPFLGLASMTLDLINFARDITGMSENEAKKKKGIQTKLEEQTKKQKELVNKPEQNKAGLSFAKTLVGYERVVNKFEEFSKNFKPSSRQDGDIFNEGASRNQTSGGNPIQPSGQEVPTSPDGLPALPPTNTLAGQAYGSNRSYGGHTGQDFDISGNEKFYSRLGGEVIFARNIGGAYGNVVEVYNKDLDKTEVIAEAQNIMPNIKEGMNIAPGTPVVFGERTESVGGSVGVVHYEITKGVGGISNRNNQLMNPLQYLGSSEYKDYIKNKINKGQNQPAQPRPQPPSPRPNSNIKRSSNPVNIFDTKITQKNGKFYQDGKEINQNEVKSFIQDFPEEFKKAGWISKRIEQYPSYDNNTVAVVFVPQPSPDKQDPVPIQSASNPITYVGSLNKDRVIALSIVDSTG